MKIKKRQKGENKLTEAFSLTLSLILFLFEFFFERIEEGKCFKERQIMKKEKRMSQ